MLTDEVIENILTDSNNKVVMHRYGVIVFKEQLTSIGGSAFWRCSGLTSVTIPNGVTNIGNYAFYDCSGLTDITYKGTTIGFKNIELGTDVFNKGVKIHCTDGDVTI